MRADAAAVSLGSPPLIRGASAVAATFAGRAQTAEEALIDGLPGLIWAPRGRPRVVWEFDVAGGRIVQIIMVADRERLARLALT